MTASLSRDSIVVAELFLTNLAITNDEIDGCVDLISGRLAGFVKAFIDTAVEYIGKLG